MAKFIYKKRLKMVLLINILVFLALSVRLYFLTTSPKLQNVANNQHEIKEEVMNNKFKILDSKGADLTKYNHKYNVAIYIKTFVRETVDGYCKENVLTLDYILKKYNSDFDITKIINNYGNKIKFSLSKEDYCTIKNMNIPGVYSYESDDVDNKEAWSIQNILLEDRRRKDASFKEEGSLERNISNWTKENSKTYINFDMDEVGNISPKGVISDNPLNVDVITTIDKRLQDKVQEVLDSEEFLDFPQISVALMESNTGEIKALTQKNNFLPNINLGIENGYFPGSTFKVVLEGLGLDEGLINLNDEFKCNGEVFDKNKKHGEITVKEALVKSCNDAFAQIGWKIGLDKLIERSKDLGFFENVLNIDGEFNGNIERTGSSGDLSLLSIGQNIRITPLQALAIINTPINDGVYIKPNILKSIKRRDGVIVKSFDSEEKRVLKESTSDLLKDNLREVVKDSENGAHNAYIEGIEMGGKTGTADRGKEADGWFIGYFNHGGKYYVMSIIIPNIGNDEYGGMTAAPVFKKIVMNIINIL